MRRIILCLIAASLFAGSSAWAAAGDDDKDARSREKSRASAEKKATETPKPGTNPGTNPGKPATANTALESEVQQLKRFSRLREHYQPRDPGSYIRRNSHAVVKRELRKVPGDHAILVPRAKPVVDADHTTNTEKRAPQHGLCGHSRHTAVMEGLGEFAALGKRGDVVGGAEGEGLAGHGGLATAGSGCRHRRVEYF